MRLWLAEVEKDGRLDRALATVHGAKLGAEDFDPFTEDFAGKDGYCLLTLQVATWALRWSKVEAEDEDVPLPPSHQALAKEFRKRGPDTLGWFGLIGHDCDTYAASAAAAIVAANDGVVPASLRKGLAIYDEAWLWLEAEEADEAEAEPKLRLR